MKSGSSHARYEHSSRPRDLHVACRSCGGLALAAKPSEVECDPVVGDCHPAWNLTDWGVRCEECPAREEGLAYSELPGPYYELEARGTVLWAWNRDHLQMLLDLLEGRDVDRHLYGWFATYARKEWLVRKNRDHLARAIRKRWPEVGPSR